MTDYVFRCDFCHELVSTSRATEHIVPQRDLDDGRVLVKIGVYCGRYCGQQGATWQAAG